MSINLRRVMLALAIIGTGLAAYLTYVHYSGVAPACTAGQSCVKVQTSVWSKVGGVPVALIGLIGYVAILLSLIVPDRDESRIATLGMTLIGLGFSGYLTYRELFSIHAVCEECAASAVIMALLFIAAVTRFIITDDLSDMPPPPAARPPKQRSSGPRPGARTTTRA